MTPYGAVNYIRHGIGYEEYLKTYAMFRKLKLEDLYEVLEELADSARDIRPLENGLSILKNIPGS